MNLLNAIFERPGIRGDIVLFAKGVKGGTRFITLDQLPTYENEKDWYFHLATHDRSLIKPGGRGSIKSSQQFTTLWCDLDLATKDNKYATEKNVKDLYAVLTSKNIEPTAVVNSGNGLHIYWVLDKLEETKTYPSACKAWITYINKLLVESSGRDIKLDQVGAMASVLRIPNTVNTKHGRLVRTLNLNDKRYDLKTLLSLTDYFKTPERGTGKAAIQSKLLQAMGAIKTSVPSYTENIIFSCGQVRNFFKTEGGVSEPEWYSMAGLLPYTEDGLDYFLNLSTQAGESVALKKVEQWKQASTGPATCKKIADNNYTICQACPHFGKITTPLQLGYSRPTVVKMKEEETSKVTFDIKHEHYIKEYVPPQPFLFDKKGQLCASVEDSAGARKVKVICHNKVIPFKRIWSEDEKQEIIYFNIETPNDGWREVDIPLSALQGSCPGLNKLMGSGALVVNVHSSLMASYLIGCVKYMQELKEVNQSYSQIGWRGPSSERDVRENDSKFVLGEITFYKSGETRRESLIPDLKKSLKDLGMKGEVDEWRQAVSILAKPGFEKHLICFMGSFAVPLFRSTDYHGLLVNMLSRESGTFKSFTLKLISSVYGQPVCDHVLNRDSEKSVYAKIATRCDLPITYDEITNIEQNGLSDLAYAITQGRRADRLNQDSSLKVNDSTWRTVMFSTSNASLDDMLSTTNLAERMRVLELPITGLDINVSDSEARKTMDMVSNNYGVAGVLWMKYVVENRDVIFKECNDMIKKLTRVTNARNDKRFWLSFLAFVLVAARHTRLLGLHSFELAPMEDTCNSILKSASSKVESDNIPLPMYAQLFLTGNLDNTITISYNSMTARQGEVIREPRSEILVKIDSRSEGPDKFEKIAHISKWAMRSYLTEMRVTYDDFIESLIDNKVLIKRNVVKSITVPGNPEVFRLMAFSIDLMRLHDLYGTEDIDKKSLIV